MAFSKINNGPGPHPVQVELHSQAVSLMIPQSLTFNSDLVIFFLTMISTKRSYLRLGVMPYSYNLSTVIKREKRENQEFKVIFIYLASIRPA